MFEFIFALCLIVLEAGLRPDVGAAGYSSVQVIELANELITRAFRGNYPVEIDCTGVFILERVHRFSSANEILSFVEPMIAELETKLNAIETNRK